MSQEPPSTLNSIASNIISSPQQLPQDGDQIVNSLSGVVGGNIIISNSVSDPSVTSQVGVNPTLNKTVPATVTMTSATAGGISPKSMQVVKSQDVRVDNWGNYCLQRLQVMYDRGDFCDLILQFHNNQILKVHRVVVNLCTEYFANLERVFGLQEGMLVLPKDVEYSTMVTIVKFFYTGKLEVKGAQFNDIYRTVKLMNILILTKLLEAHARKPIAMAKKEPSRPIVFKQAVEIGRPMTKVPGQGTVQTSTIKLASPTTVTSKTISRPLPPGVKTKTVLARVQPQTIRVGGQVIQGKLSTPKKLPIWKERKYSPATNMDPLMLEKWPPRDEPPKPTRFEWPDPSEGDDDPYVTPASHTLMERQKAAASVRKVEDIFDAVKTQTHGVKRSLGSFSPDVRAGDQSSTSPSDESPATKVPKVLNTSLENVPSSSESINISLNSTSELPTDDSALSDVNLTDETVEEVVSTSEGFSDDCIESGIGESVTSQESNALLQDTSFSFASTSDVNTTVASSTPIATTSKALKSSPVTVATTVSISTTATTKRSSMKSNTVSGGSQKVEKTVRFAPEVSEKENKSKTFQLQPQTSTEHTASIVITKGSGESSVNATSHSKIISEVLKKYPDLVKDNKNIKLKIVQKETDLPTSATAVASPSKDGKSKVSYIVLKSTSSPEAPGSVVLKKPANFANKGFWDTDKNKKAPSGAENTTGPWLCAQCASEEAPLEFDTYFNYRRHLVDIHGERIDARICEYCGQKASKRNLLLYHLYTKHGVNPPRNCVFPHCDRCDYVALSESLLTKHKQGHDVSKEFACTICNASFKSNSALQGHMAANLHRNKDTKVYECPYCRKPFVRNINLKAHIRSHHKDVARLEEMEDPRLPPDESLTNRSIAVAQQGMKKRQFPSILGAARIPSAIVPENVEEVQQGVDGLVRSLVTADGQTIEILHGIDPSALSMPVLVQSADGNTINLEAATHGHVGTEFVTGVNSDGTPAVFIMDNSQSAVEVDMSGAVGMTADGSMIFEGGDPTGGSDQFIVQDMQGNQFRKITGIDETGKQVIFFQLQDENGQMTMAPAILDDGTVARYEDAQGGETAQFDFESGQATFSVQNDHMYLDPQKCSVFVSSGGMTLPVTVSSDATVGGQAAQVLLSNLGASSIPPGHVIEFHTGAEGLTSDQNVVVTTESLMSHVQQGHVQLQAVGSEHILHGHTTEAVDGLGQQLHIVLGQNQVGVLEEAINGGNSSNKVSAASMSTLVPARTAPIPSTSTSASTEVADTLRVIHEAIDSMHSQATHPFKSVELKQGSSSKTVIHYEEQVSAQEQQPTSEGMTEVVTTVVTSSPAVKLPKRGRPPKPTGKAPGKNSQQQKLQQQQLQQQLEEQQLREQQLQEQQLREQQLLEQQLREQQLQEQQLQEQQLQEQQLQEQQLQEQQLQEQQLQEQHLQEQQLQEQQLQEQQLQEQQLQEQQLEEQVQEQQEPEEANLVVQSEVVDEVSLKEGTLNDLEHQELLTEAPEEEQQQEQPPESSEVPTILVSEETGNGEVEFQECMPMEEDTSSHQMEEQQVVELQECMEVDDEVVQEEQDTIVEQQVEEIEVQESVLVEDAIIDQSHHHEVSAVEVEEGVVQMIEEETGDEQAVETVVMEQPTQIIMEEEAGDLHVTEDGQHHEIVEEVIATEQQHIETDGSSSNVEVETAETQELVVEDAVVDVM